MTNCPVTQRSMKKNAIEPSVVLIAAMAAKCRALIHRSHQRNDQLQGPLQPKHLLWMCDRIEKNAELWAATKLHRWIGFVQCGMMAHRMLDLDDAKAMFDAVKNAHGASGDDQDLMDHLDPDSSFELDLGGQG
jgi:hypothetical protein